MNVLDLRSDVAVIGAGPVGLTAALLLAEGDARVVVMETATRPSDLPRAISIADETFRVLECLGLADALKAETFLDTGARYHGRKNRLLAETKPVPSRTGHPAKSQFDQPVMEELLWNAAVQHPNITFLTGTRATAIEQSADSVTIDFSAVERNETAGGAGRVTAQWAIGADGGKSFTRGALDIPLTGSTQLERWIVIDLLNVPGTPEPFAEFFGNGVRPHVFVPGIQGRRRMEYMIFPGEDADKLAEMPSILELSRPFFPGVTEADVRRAAVYVTHQRVAEHYRKGRVFLVGDAAHLMPPFSGQGLNAGIRDASNLSWKLLEVLRGVGSDALLNTYEAERRAHGSKMVRVSQRTGQVVMATGWWKPRLRDFCARAIQILPPLYRYFAAMKFITPPNYLNGVAVAPSGAVPKRFADAVGLAGSQPLVETSSGEAVMLDTLLGDGWAVLQVGGPGLEPLKQRFWDALGGVQIRVTTQPATDLGSVTDRTGLIADADETEICYLLLRPDRYVAAAFTAAEEARVITQLKTYLPV